MKTVVVREQTRSLCMTTNLAFTTESVMESLVIVASLVVQNKASVCINR